MMATSEHTEREMNTDHGRILSSGIYELLLQRRMLDVTITCSGEAIMAHKAVLVAFSKFLDTVFAGQGDDCDVLNMDNLGLEFEAIRAVIFFMYKGVIDVERCGMEAFTHAAKILCVDTNIQASKSESTTSSSDAPKASIGTNTDPVSLVDLVETTGGQMLVQKENDLTVIKQTASPAQPMIIQLPHGMQHSKIFNKGGKFGQLPRNDRVPTKEQMTMTEQPKVLLLTRDTQTESDETKKGASVMKKSTGIQTLAPFPIDLRGASPDKKPAGVQKISLQFNPGSLQKTGAQLVKGSLPVNKPPSTSPRMIQTQQKPTTTPVKSADKTVSEPTKVTPAQQKVITTPQKATPAIPMATLGSQKASQAAQKATPVSLKATPVSQKATPVAQKATVVSQKAIPVAQKATPASQKVTPVAQKATPAAQKANPVSQKGTPTPQKATPVVQKATPVAQKATPVVQKATPAAQKATTGSQKDLTPQKVIVAPQKSSVVSKTPAPKEDTKPEKRGRGRPPKQVVEYEEESSEESEIDEADAGGMEDDEDPSWMEGSGNTGDESAAPVRTSVRKRKLTAKARESTELPPLKRMMAHTPTRKPPVSDMASAKKPQSQTTTPSTKKVEPANTPTQRGRGRPRKLEPSKDEQPSKNEKAPCPRDVVVRLARLPESKLVPQSREAGGGRARPLR